MLPKIACSNPHAVFWLLLLLLALPPAIRHRSPLRFAWAALQVFAGILVPLFCFVASAVLIPEWKGGCRLGWFDCFVAGKLWLSPLVLWALGAFYVRVVWQSSKPAPRWLVLGYAIGAVVSAFSLVHGVLVLHDIPLMLIVPVVVAIYYCLSAWKLVKEATIRPVSWWITGLGSSPLWMASLWQSKLIYLALPDKQPQGCFVVTAAMGGHESIVGPRFKVLRAGRERLVNRQLLTFWAFESAWQNVAPRSHSQFRKIYNILGPHIAARVTHPWVADMVHLLLKPGEWLASILLRTCR